VVRPRHFAVYNVESTHLVRVLIGFLFDGEECRCRVAQDVVASGASRRFGLAGRTRRTRWELDDVLVSAHAVRIPVDAVRVAFELVVGLDEDGGALGVLPLLARIVGFPSLNDDDPDVCAEEEVVCQCVIRTSSQYRPDLLKSLMSGLYFSSKARRSSVMRSGCLRSTQRRERCLRTTSG
jgi:hypothetical protein